MHISHTITSMLRRYEVKIAKIVKRKKQKKKRKQQKNAKKLKNENKIFEKSQVATLEVGNVNAKL